MAFTRVAALLHAALSDVAAAQHHTATVASDLNLADLAARAHSDLSDAPTDAHHTLYTDAEAVLAVEAEAELAIAGQIKWPASQSASADANVLDDYEEGLWTPGLGDNDGDGTGEGQSYAGGASNAGFYTKIGRVCFVYGRLEISGLGSLTGGEGAKLTGLPFTSATVATKGGMSVHHGASLAIVDQTALVVHIENGVTVGEIKGWSAATGTIDVTVTEISAGGTLIFHGFYEVA